MNGCSFGRRTMLMVPFDWRMRAASRTAKSSLCFSNRLRQTLQ